MSHVGQSRYCIDVGVLRNFIFTEPRADLVPIHTGHGQIEKYDFRPEILDQAQGFGTVGRRSYTMPFQPKEGPKEIQIVHVVIDHEDTASS